MTLAELAGRPPARLAAVKPNVLTLDIERLPEGPYPLVTMSAT